MDLDANQLRDKVRRDELSAAVEIIEHFYERIYAFLRRLTGKDADAADLTQRTFARVQQSLSSFAGLSSVSSWVHSIAYHTYVDWRRVQRGNESRPDEWWEAYQDSYREFRDALRRELTARGRTATLVSA